MILRFCFLMLICSGACADDWVFVAKTPPPNEGYDVYIGAVRRDGDVVYYTAKTTGATMETPDGPRAYALIVTLHASCTARQFSMTSYRTTLTDASGKITQDMTLDEQTLQAMAAAKGKSIANLPMKDDPLNNYVLSHYCK